MKLCVSCTLLFVLLILIGRGQDANHPEAVSGSLQALDARLANNRPWNDGPLSVDDQQALDRSQQAIDATSNDPGYFDAVLALLDRYSGQDGFSRQVVLNSVLRKKNYTAADLPFLRTVFQKSLGFHYDEYGRGADKIWLVPDKIRIGLAIEIATLTKRSEAVDDSGRLLVYRDPAAWIAKYGH